jgi:hypothetical protein
MKVTSYAMASFVESGQIKGGGDATERLRARTIHASTHSGVQFSGRMVGVPTDAELVARCRTGDDGAWALLVERFARYVHAIPREHPVDSALIEDLDIAADDLIAELEQALTVRVAMAELPTLCGDVLDRCFARDETYATIGAALDIPAGAIAARIAHCLGRLRSKLEARSCAPAPFGAR